MPIIHIGASTQRAYDEASVRQQQGGSNLIGLSTGFPKLDQVLGGLRPDAMYVVAGRPGSGKSSLGVSIAMETANTGDSVLLVSLEMQATLLSYRILSGMTGIPANDIEFGNLPLGGIERVQQAVAECQAKPFWIMDDTSNTEALVDVCNTHKQEHGLDLLVIDYLSLLTDGVRENEAARVGTISRNVRNLARLFQIPVLCLAQLNRNVEAREGNRPVLSDIGWSGNIEQDAMAVLMLYRPQYYEVMYNRAEPRDVEDDAEIIVAKNRQGPAGSILAHFYPNQMKWAPIDVAVRDIPTRGR